MRILLLNPPLADLNTPCPATTYLTGFLRSRGEDVRQADACLELVLRLFSRSGLARMREALDPHSESAEVRGFLRQFDRYQQCVEPAIRMLQGKDDGFARRVARREFLPEGPAFEILAEHRRVQGNELRWAFGKLGVHDQAKYLASLFVCDLFNVVRAGIDPHFELRAYAESLADSVITFDPLRDSLEKSSPTLVDRILEEITEEYLRTHCPDVVGITIPFPGNVYGALRMARRIKSLVPGLPVVVGGGYCNTELRSLSDPRVFDYVDFITLDDGERPLLCLLDHLRGNRGRDGLLRTFVREDGSVVLKSGATEHDIPHRETGTPTYAGFKLDQYIAVMESLNPMIRIWTETRWNKLTLAHGCYWRKCSFCDVHLDYVSRYDPAAADLIVDRMEELIRETGQRGFHFVDEAAPPALLKALALRLQERKLSVSWWGNIRFDKAFTPELAGLLARSGCIGVSGGLEVASDRLLKLMNKGVSVEQVARVTRAFADARVLVHAYLMYGFPTQTEQETVDALERVRQLFAAGCIQSAHWHRFTATAHSPIARDPEKFGIRPLAFRKPVTFACYALPFADPTGTDHGKLSEGLWKALSNYMHGTALEADVRIWFEGRVPKPQVPRDLIARALKQDGPDSGMRAKAAGVWRQLSARMASRRVAGQPMDL